MKLIAAIWLITISASAAGMSDYYTEIGPFNANELEEYKKIESPSADTNEMGKIQGILSTYKLTRDIKDDNFDCSNISEIIFCVLEKNGYDCDIVVNTGKENNVSKAHMYVWIYEPDGVIVVDPTWDAIPEERIGVVIENIDREDDKFYLQGWVFDTPIEFLETTHLTNEITGMTAETPITDLQIRRIYTEEELEQHQIEIYRILHGDD
jgi:hypothetical protein